MAHISEPELTERLRQAQREAPVGSSYVHYKHPELAYRIVGHAILEADEAPAVIYQAQYGGRVTFVRPLASWTEQVEWRGSKVARFQRVTS